MRGTTDLRGFSSQRDSNIESVSISRRYRQSKWILLVVQVGSSRLVIVHIIIWKIIKRNTEGFNAVYFISVVQNLGLFWDHVLPTRVVSLLASVCVCVPDLTVSLYGDHNIWTHVCCHYSWAFAFFSISFHLINSTLTTRRFFFIILLQPLYTLVIHSEYIWCNRFGAH